ncbi:MAG: PilN domain-containing protein [Rhodocyclaceae bacterium]|nr:PilN domain-containing protein [Rhodocyclaceae bacterium]
MKFLSFSGAPGYLKLDFQRPAAGWGASSRLGLVVLALGLALAGWQVWRYLDLKARADAVEQRVAEMRKKPANGQAVPDEALPGLNNPWGRLLSDLAGAGSDDIALLALDADGGRGTLRVMGEAKSLDDVLAYVRRLADTGSLPHPELVSHELKKAEEQPVVGFTLRAGWGGR